MHQRNNEAISTRLLKVGMELLPVFGDEDHGWSMDPVDLDPLAPSWCRYDTLDELYFALLNFNLCEEGRA